MAHVVVREEQRQAWTPHPDVLCEYRWVREWQETWNPLPYIRASYRTSGWVWWVIWIAYMGFTVGFIAR